MISSILFSPLYVLFHSPNILKWAVTCRDEFIFNHLCKPTQNLVVSLERILSEEQSTIFRCKAKLHNKFASNSRIPLCSIPFFLNYSILYVSFLFIILYHHFFNEDKKREGIFVFSTVNRYWFSFPRFNPHFPTWLCARIQSDLSMNRKPLLLCLFHKVSKGS